MFNLVPTMQHFSACKWDQQQNEAPEIQFWLLVLFCAPSPQPPHNIFLVAPLSRSHYPPMNVKWRYRKLVSYDVITKDSHKSLFTYCLLTYASDALNSDFITVYSNLQYLWVFIIHLKTLIKCNHVLIMYPFDETLRSPPVSVNLR